MKKKIKLSERKLQQIIKQSVNEVIDGYYNNGLMSEGIRRMHPKKINETLSYGDISDALVKCGWSYSDAYEVYDKYTGQSGVRFIIEPYGNNLEGIKPFSLEELKQKMTEILGQENVIFSEGHHAKIPQIRNLSMVVLDDED